MSDRLGPLALSPSALTGDGSTPPWSEATAAAIDEESRAILAEAAWQAATVVEANREVIVAMADALDQAESLEGDSLEVFLSRYRCLRRPTAPEVWRSFRDWDTDHPTTPVRHIFAKGADYRDNLGGKIPAGTVNVRVVLRAGTRAGPGATASVQASAVVEKVSSTLVS